MLISLKWLNVVNDETTTLSLSYVAGPTIASSRLQSILDSHKLTPVAIWENLHLSEVKDDVLKVVKPLAGVYVIVNLINGKMYVGSATTGRMGNRFYKHLYGGNGSSLVWAAIQKYGLQDFAFVVVETLPSLVTREDNKDLLTLEDHYIVTLLPSYNIAPKAGNTFGFKHKEETKEAMSLNYSSERREAIGSLNRGKSLAPSTIELMREAALKRGSMPDSIRAKVSANSTVAQLYEVSQVDGSSFSSPDGVMVTSVTLRTIPVVANFIGCNERTVRRALKSNGIVLKLWHVIALGKAIGS
uniref:GIY-YIG domain-containing protein n=1 Tax=Volvariella volvacea TaxID=36659 RepID=A0A5H2QA06_9AGAR|nr:hypothetical protein [Volvariella volvacea]